MSGCNRITVSISARCRDRRIGSSAGASLRIDEIYRPFMGSDSVTERFGALRNTLGRDPGVSGAALVPRPGMFD